MTTVAHTFRFAPTARNVARPPRACPLSVYSRGMLLGNKDSIVSAVDGARARLGARRCKWRNHAHAASCCHRNVIENPEHRFGRPRPWAPQPPSGIWSPPVAKQRRRPDIDIRIGISRSASAFGRWARRAATWSLWEHPRRGTRCTDTVSKSGAAPTWRRVGQGLHDRFGRRCSRVP